MNTCHPQIAIVGMSCQYPDAKNPQELWENVLAKRRAFRRFPDERLCLDDYFSSDKSTPDAIYSKQAAVIEGYDFDRIAFRVVGSTFRAADLVHWLALDMASQALNDAGFIEGKNLPNETTGVLLGNTLTGEFSRANTLRLRWPYVRRVVQSQLINQGFSLEETQIFIDKLEIKYKEPFEPIGEESLAGNLSNTIAGRICNHFNLKGGGYTIDGACSSSLLAVANACNQLLTGDLDLALAGGVDLSIDPFELVGFAKASALAEKEMRVYDKKSAGFIPGEGCGFVVLMRYEDALEQQKRIYGVIRGWGISSDGHGGMTRPEVDGQLLAVKRAYSRAGLGVNTVSYFEGHGTGTPVGDGVELQVLSRAIKETINPNNTVFEPAYIGSIKANIGHTKAAAGIAGLIKATMAVYSQIIPPTTGCETPHDQLTKNNPVLQVNNIGKLWPIDRCLRAGVSAMGFGGINTYIVLEGLGNIRRQKLTAKEQDLITSYQDAELLLFTAETKDELRTKLSQLLEFSYKLSSAEITDLSAKVNQNIDFNLQIRAAVIANKVDELTSQLQELILLIDGELKTNLNTGNVFLRIKNKSPKIGFLFPGQSAPVYDHGGLWQDRFSQLKMLYETAQLPNTEDKISTKIAQPAIVTSTIAGLKILETFGIKADVAVGNSLGELCALYWAEVFDETALIRLAKVRGKAMAELGDSTGKMASLGTDENTVKGLLNGRVVVIAGINSPQQTIISGEDLGVKYVIEKAVQKNIKTVLLPVSHAFHSPLVSQAVKPLADYLKNEQLSPVQKQVISTITGQLLTPENDLRSLLIQQVTSPVHFLDAVSLAQQDVDLFIEVGPGQILGRIVSSFSKVPVISLDSGGDSLKGLLQAVGAAFVLGVNINHKALFKGRFTRSFNLDWKPKFFVNPCELAPENMIDEVTKNKQEKITQKIVPHLDNKEVIDNISVTENNDDSPLNCLRKLISEKTELPIATIEEDHRLLGDLHLNSISVGQLVAEAARRLGLSAPVSPTDYANATVGDIAQALTDLSQTKDIKPRETLPLGIDSWIRSFTVEFVESPLIASLPTPNNNASQWRIITPMDYALKTPLEAALSKYEGNGVVVCLPPNPDEQIIDSLLEGAKIAINNPNNCFILVQHGGGAASFARTLYLENSQIKTCVIDVPFNHPNNINWIVTEALLFDGYTEIYYDHKGIRRSRILKSVEMQTLAPLQKSRINLSSNDVLCVTGGGKGIAAECALSIAKETGVNLVLLGRSRPQNDEELSHNLVRMQSLGIKVIYVSVDITNADQVNKCLTDIQKELGTITAVIHGAGINKPKLIQNLEKEDVLETLAPKVQGLKNVLAAINSDSLKHLITFGSIIAETGLPGEADYGLGNEWLGHYVAEFKEKYPHCHCLNVAWSVWSGVGMGEKLGRIDSLMQQGITPIPPDQGIDILRRLITQSFDSTTVIVSGRFGEPPTLKIEPLELPFLRFLEQQKVSYPGVELIVDVELSLDNDPYIKDHVYEGEYIFPGVMGLEAMMQVATSLMPNLVDKITIESVKFNRPIVVSANEPLKIRIAALIYPSGKVKTVIRSEQTGFTVDHFTTIISQARNNSELGTVIPIHNIDNQQNNIDPQQHLYGELLFHGGRFQRIKHYEHLTATECMAEIETKTNLEWFSRYLPQSLILGDPGARDAVIHALQACVPHATILPIGIEKLSIYEVNATQNQFVSAKERQHFDDTFIYDLTVFDAEGNILEVWQGLELQIIKHKNPDDPWISNLLPPYLERNIKAVVPDANLTLIIDQDATVERRVRSDRNLTVRQKAKGKGQKVYRRLDGKPEINGEAISVSHTGALTLVVKGGCGCDVEPVIERSGTVWHDLLGTHKLALADIIAAYKQESLDVSATRIWTANECLKKAGMMVDTPLMLMNQKAVSKQKKSTSKVVWLTAGETIIATFVVAVKGFETPLVFAVLVKEVKEHEQVLKEVRSLDYQGV
ncbi:type I polyketide synthase [Aphanothece sacrum]|uniref:Beta-ketoacyl synthase n=1 Tax=Aphanothece sacrum FPU1 TaxID=1920663 RepID=A0A401IG57_APHSA|nr:type I polyketide synthase [Aphanothece sacrum]GBF80275.1 beta-ketoacyl synthase [Aphanothece sacrum FPU1]GBF83680.1 beta-ketoacyl synthase [Aphanothece sacrum FPU3]